MRTGSVVGISLVGISAVTVIYMSPIPIAVPMNS
jgi:hypothetical protein